MGSPPHRRGKGQPLCLDDFRIGITPAQAGKSRIIRFTRSKKRDHPRTGGEKECFLLKYLSKRGSPPHRRGKVQRAEGLHPPGRDHPRTGGEKQDVLHCDGVSEGSPPHRRGKAERSTRMKKSRGITPAQAGKRLKRSRSTVPSAAIVPLFPSVCNKPVGSDGSLAELDAPLFLPAENAVPASPAYSLRSL